MGTPDINNAAETVAGQEKNYEGVSGNISFLEDVLGRKLEDEEAWAVTEYMNQGGDQENFEKAGQIYEEILKETVKKHDGKEQDTIGENISELAELGFER